MERVDQKGVRILNTLPKCFVVGLALMLGGATQAMEFWFAPPGWTGPTAKVVTATSREQPLGYPATPVGEGRTAVGERAESFASMFRRVLGGEYLPAGDTNLVIQFLPGKYPVTQLYPSSGWFGTTNYEVMTKTVLRIGNGWGMGTNNNPVILQLVADAGRWTPERVASRFTELGLISTKPYDSETTNYLSLARFEMENLVVDCNWDGLGGWTSPSHNGFKVFGVRASGMTGRIRNVTVLNAGSCGMAPSPSSAPSGVEGFPIMAYASDYYAEPFRGANDPTPWVIEGCEVYDFHSIRGGYACGISLAARFPALVDGKPVPGHLTSEERVHPNLKTAHGGAQYWFQLADLPANRERRYGTIRNCTISIIGSAFGVANGGGLRLEDNIVVNGTGLNCDTGHTRNVDVLNSVFLDVIMCANVGSWSPNSGWAFFQNWRFNGNLIRIDRHPAGWDYTDYRLNPDTKALETRPSSVRLPIFTTNSMCFAFGLGSCNTIDLSSNRVTTRPRSSFFEPNPADTQKATFRLVTRPAKDDVWGLAIDQSRSEPVMRSFQLSGVAYDFAKYTEIGGDPSQRYSNQLAIAEGPRDIARKSAFGNVRRVERVTTAGGRLGGVKEVAIATPRARSDGSAAVQARWALHPTPMDREHSETTPLSPDAIRFIVQDATGHRVKEGEPDKSRYISTLVLPSSLSNGYYRIIAYVPKSSGSSGFDPSRDAWSETEYLKGSTVRFGTGPDLANDAVPYPGSLVLTRTGEGALSVKIKQLTGVGRDATYGKDFTVMVKGKTIPIADDGTFAIPFDADERKQTVDLMPIKDSELEYEAATFIVLDGGDAYRAAPSLDWPGFPPTRAPARPDIFPAGSWKFSSSVLFCDVVP